MPITPTEALERLAHLPVLDYEQAIGRSLTDWTRDCHGVSLALVRSGLVTEVTGHRARVARGYAAGVDSQHSWIVLGDDCYGATVPVLDLTLWSYLPKAPVVYTGMAGALPHRPHQSDSIFAAGMPTNQGGPVVELTPSKPLGLRAEGFLRILGPLDARGWSQLAHSPMQDWPSSDIVSAMYETKELTALIPIDIVGMLTEHNPGELYF